MADAPNYGKIAHDAYYDACNRRIGCLQPIKSWEEASEMEQFAWHAAGAEVAKAIVLFDNQRTAEAFAVQPSKQEFKPKTIKKGWAWPVNSRKAHYFFDARSLCGKMAFFGDA